MGMFYTKYIGLEPSLGRLISPALNENFFIKMVDDLSESLSTIRGLENEEKEGIVSDILLLCFKKIILYVISVKQNGQLRGDISNPYEILYSMAAHFESFFSNYKTSKGRKLSAPQIDQILDSIIKK